MVTPPAPPAPALPTRAENLATVLTGLDRLEATAYERYCTVLTADAESDWKSSAVQRETIGVFQQNPRYWASATKGTAAQLVAFLADFRTAERAGYHSPTADRDPVLDCWVTQRWAVPNEGKTWPDPGPGFRTATETVNYTRRLDRAKRILSTGRLPD